MFEFTYKRNKNAWHLIAAILVSILIYPIYVWIYTQSTNNAYISAEISTISAEINGVIDEIYIKENNPVEKGQLIAKIHDTKYQAIYDKILAHYVAAEHNVDIIEKQLSLALIEYEKLQEVFEFIEMNYKISTSGLNRVKELHKDKYASTKRMDDAVIKYENVKKDFMVSRLDLTIAKEKIALLEIKKHEALAKLHVIEQEQNMAKQDLNHTNVVSPIKGVLGNDGLRIGNYVRVGMPIFSVVPMDKLYIKANFKETQITTFAPGVPAKITIDAMPSFDLEGAIRNVAPATGSTFSLLPPENATGNFTKIVQRVPVLIDFTVPDQLLTKIVPGMSVNVKIRTDFD